MQLSFLLSSSSFCDDVAFGGFILIPIAQFTHSISLLLYWYIPYKLAKFYTEYEPHGKKCMSLLETISFIFLILN